MYRFQVSALTQPGETLALVGSVPEMGSWDITRCVRLHTSDDRYPVWSVDLDLSYEVLGGGGDRRADYKYVRIGVDGYAEWEAWGTNRWVPIHAESLPSTVIVDDGWYGTIQPYPYGYFADPIEQTLPPQGPEGLKILVIGSSVAMGCSAWLLQGWAWHLGQTLNHRYGHQLVNRSELGANVGRTIARFPQVVAPEQPDMVIIALSLGNEGLASSSPQQHRAIQRRFENGLLQLVKMTRELGACPVLAGVYPNGGYRPEHYALLQETHQRMLTWGVPVLNWLSVVDDGQGRWKPGIFFDSAHPNTIGHQQMFAAIDLNFFDRRKADLAGLVHPNYPAETSIYRDDAGFHLFVRHADHSLRIINTTPYAYTLTPDWPALQAALQAAKLSAGVYLAENLTTTPTSALFVEDDGTIATKFDIAPSTDLSFYPAVHFFAPERSQVLIDDQHLSILKLDDRSLCIINESDHEYNVHPMWKEVRAVLKAMPAGVYEDLNYPDAPFRTMMIGAEGLESRVKAPAKSAIVLTYRCSLSEVSRVAIVPLGARCAARMLLYKLEFDGPAFPFDLTRTTSLADVADIIKSDFSDMWNPAYLHYSPEARRIYHTKWTGLSFAHEVEDTDDPIHNMAPVYERMRTRYSARARRFRYTLQQCDKALFVRAGVCDRNEVMDLMEKLAGKCAGKPFRLLLLSPQPSEEFAGLPDVVHSDLEFNPDRMYEDLDYWMACTKQMGEILTSLGISSRNLFWCPPTPPQI